MERENRIVVLIDMDCFYCQVEEKLNPELKGKPIAVVQYNPWKGGGIIAVNYVARDQGVTRHMRGDEAKEKCPEIQLPSVPCQRGKADISKYREAGKEVARVLQRFTNLLERASIDEAYLDITETVNERLKSTDVNTIAVEQMPNTFALGYASVDEFAEEVQGCCSENMDFDYEHARMLLVGAVVVSEIRAAVYEDTGYRCSAGISHNKILAKLVCGMNKPNKQTILPKHCVNILYKTLSIKKVKHLGGKFGDAVCAALQASTMGELQKYSERELQARFDERNGTWLYNIARGVDLEPVQARFNPKSIGCCKQFKGKAALLDLDGLRKWLKDLGAEIEDRLEKDALENNRTPRQMVVSYTVQAVDGRDVGSSRSHNFARCDDLAAELVAEKALELVCEGVEGSKLGSEEPNRKLQMPIKFLGISVGKFEDHTETKKTRKINDFFGAGTSKENIPDKKIKDENVEDNKIKVKSEKEYVLQKFFQTSEKDSKNTNEVKQAQSNKPVVEAALDKQESFFAKYLNQAKQAKPEPRPTTPLCKVVPHEENSRDSTSSTSTINEEINKSINLFGEDASEVHRVASMRNLLTSTNHVEDITPVSEPVPATFVCPDCGKTIPLAMTETHADYHLALKLREEERRIARDGRKSEVAKPAIKPKQEKTEGKSIADFLVKFDETVPTEMCTECGRKVTVDKISEHKDFHEAQRLSRELNGKPASSFANKGSVKRKNSNTPESKAKMLCKPISSFFR